MPNLIDRKDLLTLAAAGKRLPGRPHRSTLFRWADKGIVAPNGRRVYLRVRRLGRRILVAPEDIEAFAESLSEPVRATATTETPPPKRRPKRAQAAEDEAAAMGL